MMNNKLNNLDVIDKFKNKLSQLTKDDQKNLNRPPRSREIELLMKKLFTKKSLGPGGSTDKFYQSLKN